MAASNRQTKTTAEAAAVAPQPSDGIIREPECRRLSGLSRSTRWRLERAGKFPQRRQISDNAVGWFKSELLAWLASKAA
jgi:prophage regulatory protein